MYILLTLNTALAEIYASVHIHVHYKVELKKALQIVDVKVSSTSSRAKNRFWEEPQKAVWETFLTVWWHIN